MINICICICTRNRQEGLEKLLNSIINTQIPPDTRISIIVVENDVIANSQKTVNEFSSKCNFSISYFLETQQGISYARNRSVKEALNSNFCCFVDDDQIVASDWLIELVKCQREFDADGVWGTNPPIFNKVVPQYIRKFHAPETFKYGEIVIKAYTNCLMIRKEWLDKIEGPFDLRLNFTGGEDRYLTYLISKKGGIIRCNPQAIAYEIIPESRTTIKYVLRRMYKMSNTALFVNSLEDQSFSKWSALPRLLLRFSLGVLVFVPFFCLGKANKIGGLIRIANSIGGFAYIIGSRDEYYK